MTIGCARCGDCCDPVVLDPAVWDRIQTGDSADRASVDFAREHWTVVGEIEDGDGDRMLQIKCDQFDPGTRLCGAHDERPPVCGGFPWYGRSPSIEGKVMSWRCSYWADVPTDQRPPGTRPLLPVTVAQSRTDDDA